MVSSQIQPQMWLCKLLHSVWDATLDAAVNTMAKLHTGGKYFYILGLNHAVSLNMWKRLYRLNSKANQGVSSRGNIEHTVDFVFSTVRTWFIPRCFLEIKIEFSKLQMSHIHYIGTSSNCLNMNSKCEQSHLKTQLLVILEACCLSVCVYYCQISNKTRKKNV